MVDNWQWIFALSIDDEVTWAITQANCLLNIDAENAYRNRPRHGTLVKLRDSDRPQMVIHSRLMELRDRDPHLREAFENTVAVGVSTLGVVDRGEPHAPTTSRPRLVSIFRKSWQKPSADCDYVLDFRLLFDMFGRGNLRIAAENDATAYCLAEYQHRDDAMRDQTKVVYYVVLSDGVNAGFLVNGFAPDLPLHPEVGHIRPARYEHDLHFDAKRHSGCTVHGDCFEGLASNTRIKKQWGRPLHALANETGTGTPVDIISAYAADLAWAGACAVAPDKIIIGGHVVVDDLMPLIRTKFDKLNGGYLPRYPVGKTGEDSFIQLAKLRQNEGILGGLEIARRAAAPRRPFGSRS